MRLPLTVGGPLGLGRLTVRVIRNRVVSTPSLTFEERVAQSSAFSNSAVLSIRRAAEFLRRETLRCLLTRNWAKAAELNPDPEIGLARPFPSRVF
jgi:hypothetical protein